MFCEKCGKELREGVKFCPGCGKAIEDTSASQGIQTPIASFNTSNIDSYNPKGKNKTIAGLLAVFLGGLGIHKFYMGKYGQGIFYMLLCWTYVPAIVGLIEGIIYFTDSDEKFNNRCK